MTIKNPSVDPKCYELAVHFLADMPGVLRPFGTLTEKAPWKLAAIFQREAEDFCRDLEPDWLDPAPPGG